MKKTLLYFIVFLTSTKVFAATYYVDPAGKDSNNGTSPSTPWQTLVKVNSVSFKAGDNILFLKGGVFTGTITIKSNGVSGQPISWGSYGSGANPVISGFITASGWVNAGNGIWTYTNAALGLTTPNIVTINGTVQPLGRFPKTTNNIYTAHKTTTSITDAGLSNSPSYVGGEVVIRTVHWSLTRGTIKSQSGGVIKYTSTSKYAPTDGFYYFIQNNINCLTQFGDWCYNTSTNTISMYFGSANPSTYTIKISGQAALFNINWGITNNSFSGLNLQGADFAFEGTKNTNITITNCTITAIGHNAIDFGYSTNVVITGNTISNCNNDGIACWISSINCIVSSNNVTGIGIIPGAGENDTGTNNEGAYSGIDVSGVSNTLQYNVINHTGYNGLESDGDGYLVNENFVDSACTVIDDGGGIYTDTTPTAIVNERTISNNIVINVLGSLPAASQPNQGNGIYLDDGSSLTNVTGNVVANCGQNGYFFHNAHNVTMTNNLAYNNSFAQFLILYDNDIPALTGVNKNLSYTNNTFIANTSGQYDFIFQSFASNSSPADYTEIGTADNNHYGSLSSNTTVFNHHLEPAGVIVSGNLTAWSALSSLDVHSTFSAPTYISKVFQYNASTAVTSLSFSGKIYFDIVNNQYPNSANINPFSAVVLLYNGVTCSVPKPTIHVSAN
jgi:parallel beta-helix repeat protein